MEIVIVYTTLSSESAENIRDSLVKEGLAACGVMLEGSSSYIWKGSLTEDEEMVLLLKTLPEKETHLRTRLEELHPYDTPSILSWRAEANDAYVEWMKD